MKNQVETKLQESQERADVAAVAALVAILVLASIDDIERLMHKAIDPAGYQKVLDANDGTYPPSFSD